MKIINPLNRLLYIFNNKVCTHTMFSLVGEASCQSQVSMLMILGRTGRLTKNSKEKQRLIMMQSNVET